MWNKHKFLALPEQRILKELLRRAREIEVSASNGDIVELKNLLEYLQEHSSPALKRLSQNSGQLQPGSAEANLPILLTAIERLLGQAVSDHQFLPHVDEKNSQSPALPVSIVLDNLRSAFNVGSVFRTASFFNFEQLFLCGYTPHPGQPQVEKAAMGTTGLVQFEQQKQAPVLIEELKKKGVRVIALEISSGELPGASFTPEPTAIVLGNERFGLSEQVLSQADAVFSIQGNGPKYSLNVASAFAIAAYELARVFAVNTP